METYVANIPKDAHVLALEDKSNKTVDPAKRPAPLTSGCRIEGFVRVKKVNELLRCNSCSVDDDLYLWYLISGSSLSGPWECCNLSSIWFPLL